MVKTLIKKYGWFFGVITMSINSCFIGPDTYERSINDYFWLYGDTYEKDCICIGTIVEKQHRFGDSYLCHIENIGWDETFLICKTRGNEYFIQDLRTLDGKRNDDFRMSLSGPYTKQLFEQKKDSLGVNSDLDFQINY